MADTDNPEIVRPADEVCCRSEPELPWEELLGYASTELDLYSTEDLTALAAALEARGMEVRYRALRIDAGETEWHRIGEPQWHWLIVAGGEACYQDPEPEIAAILTAVEALDPPARAAWDRCSLRVFNAGYYSGTTPFSIRHDLSPGTLARLAVAGGLLRFTLYRFDPRKDKPAAPGSSCADD